MKTPGNNEEHLLGCLMLLYIYVITKEGGDYWISDKVWAVWAVLSDNIDISHRSEFSSLFSRDNAVDNRVARPTGRPRHRFGGNIKAQLAPLDVLVYRVLGLYGPDILPSQSAWLRFTAGDSTVSVPGRRDLKVPLTTVSTTQASLVSEVLPVDL